MKSLRLIGFALMLLGFFALDLPGQESGQASSDESAYLCDSRLLRSSMAWRIVDFLERRAALNGIDEDSPLALEFIKYIRAHANGQEPSCQFTIRIRQAEEQSGGPAPFYVPRVMTETFVEGEYSLDSTKTNDGVMQFRLRPDGAATTIGSQLRFGPDGTLKVPLREIEPFLALRPEDVSRVDFSSIPSDAYLLVIYVGNDQPVEFVGKTPVEECLWPKGEYQFLIYKPEYLALDAGFVLGDAAQPVAEQLTKRPLELTEEDREFEARVAGFFATQASSGFDRRDHAIRLMAMARKRTAHGK